MAKVITVSRDSTRVSVDLVESDGKVYVTLNGVNALAFTAKGYLSRLKDLPPSIGFRRLPDGRVAIRKRSRR